MSRSKFNLFKRWFQLGVPCTVFVLIEWSFYKLGLRVQANFPANATVLDAIFAGFVCPIAGFITMKYVYTLSIVCAAFYFSILAVIFAKIFTEICKENLWKFCTPIFLIYLGVFNSTYLAEKQVFITHATFLGILLAWYHARHKPKLYRLSYGVLMLSLSILGLFNYIIIAVLNRFFGSNIILPNDWQFIIQSICALGILHSTICTDDFNIQLNRNHVVTSWLSRLSFPVYLCHLQILQVVGLFLLDYFDSIGQLNYYSIWFVIHLTTLTLVAVAVVSWYILQWTVQSIGALRKAIFFK